MNRHQSCSVLIFGAAFVLCTFLGQGEAYAPLHVDGKGGFWNQIVIGKDTAYSERIGGLTIKGKRPALSLIDRETPTSFDKRWDLTSHGDDLAVFRAMGTKLMSLDRYGNAIFAGKMKVDGVLRVKNLALEGVTAGAEEDASTLKIGTDATASMRMGSNDKAAWIQADKKDHLVFNPRLDGDKVSLGVAMFSEDVPKHTVDAKGDLFVQNSIRLGKGGKTTLENDQLTFAMGGGWTSTDPGWISSLKAKPVQFGGAVFGTRLGVGVEAIKDPTVRLEVHNGHFVVSSKIGKFLKGLTTYVMPEGSHMKAYDYTRKKLQKWRVTGTKILLNPSQQSDGRVCIGCETPEHHLQSEGNMYVNGNVFVNKHLHVQGHMHIDKIITPRVLVHSTIETPQYGRGIMIGNDLPNKWGTKTNMRIGYTKQYAWVQSHRDVPLVINPLGGATCIACKQPSKEAELQIGGNALVDGELYVATLNKKPKAASSEVAEERDAFSLAEAKTLLEQEMGAVQLNVMSAWSSATKIVQDNHRRIVQRRSRIQQNHAAIEALEKQLSALK